MKNNSNAIKQKEDMANAIVRVVLCSVGLCIVMLLMLMLFKKYVPEALLKYEEKGNMEHTAWLVKYGACLPPVIIIVGLLTACYPERKYVPLKTQRDKAIIIAIVAAFTYLILFPSIKGGDRKTYDNCVGWFFAQAIPFLIVLSYHIIRASSEKRELEADEK